MIRRLRPPGGRRDWLGLAAVLAGPFLITGCVLLVLRGFLIRPMVTTGDLVRYWMPMYCSLGRSIAAGHIPAWNPYVMSGMPLAADPQSGWMSLPVMALFTSLPCGLAIRVLVVFQPVLAGLGMYWFLRSEEVSRPAATIGGLAMGLGIAGSRLPVSIRFPGALAWTVVTLAATSRCVRARTWPGRLTWMVLAAVSWGQIAASHLTVGLVLGTGAVAAYLASVVFPRPRGRAAAPYQPLALVVVLATAFVAVNLAYLIPRLAYAGSTNLSLGWSRLSKTSEQLVGVASPQFPGLTAGPRWPLRFATVPGRYAGAVALMMAFPALWSRRRRPMALGLMVYGLVCYLASLKWLVAKIPQRFQSLTIMDQYLHDPIWMGFGLLIALAALAGLGLDAWRQADGWRTRIAMLVPALAIWLVLPLGFGAPAVSMVLFVAGAVVGLVVLVAGVRSPRVALLIAPIVAAESLVGVFLDRPTKLFEPAPGLLQALNEPSKHVSDYLMATPISQVLRQTDDGRYITIGLSSGTRYSDPAALQNDESMLREISNVGGYQAIQLRRYWFFVRTLERIPMKYNYAIFANPSPVVLDLLQVNWEIVGGEGDPPAGTREVARDGRWVLVRKGASFPRASVLSTWRVVRSEDDARRRVASASFDPQREVVLEENPALSSLRSGGPGSSRITYSQLGPQAARLGVDAVRPSIVLVRNMWDPNWHARMDGRSVRVLPADYILQGVPVPAGRHVIVLTYDDPTIGYGMLGSAAALIVLLGGAWLMRKRERGGEEEVNPPGGREREPSAGSDSDGGNQAG